MQRWLRMCLCCCTPQHVIIRHAVSQNVPQGVSGSADTSLSVAGKPATKTTLLHMEDFKIPEHLSRFAVKHGMWGFIKQMTPKQVEFIRQRRARGLAPNEADRHAFGASGDSTSSTVSRENSVIRRGASDGTLSSQSANGRSRMRRVASAVVAGGMLVALSAGAQGGSRGGSQGSLRRRGSVANTEGGDSDDDEGLAQPM